MPLNIFRIRAESGKQNTKNNKCQTKKILTAFQVTLLAIQANDVTAKGYTSSSRQINKKQAPEYMWTKNKFSPITRTFFLNNGMKMKITLWRWPGSRQLADRIMWFLASDTMAKRQRAWCTNLNGSRSTESHKRLFRNLQSEVLREKQHFQHPATPTQREMSSIIYSSLSRILIRDLHSLGSCLLWCNLTINTAINLNTLYSKIQIPWKMCTKTVQANTHLFVYLSLSKYYLNSESFHFRTEDKTKSDNYPKLANGRNV